MKAEKFQRLLDELDGNSLQTLKEKNARYAQNGDCLHNFRSGADIAGGSPAQACWGYVTKHLVALRDMVEKNDFSNREDFLEKCQDTINYIRFLWCIGNDNTELERAMDNLCKTIDAMESNVTPDMVTINTLPYKPCVYESERMHPYGDRQCLAEEKFTMCKGHVNCDNYTHKEESIQNDQITDSSNPRNS